MPRGYQSLEERSPENMATPSSRNRLPAARPYQSSRGQHSVRQQGGPQANNLNNGNGQNVMRPARPNTEHAIDVVGSGNQARALGQGIAPSDIYPPLYKVFMPEFDKHTFIFMITCVQLVMMVVTFIVGAFNDGAFVRENSSAGPSTCTFDKMGGKHTAKIQSGQVHRLVVPIVLHAGLLHIFMNLLFQGMFGYRYEHLWGTRRTALLYVVAGIGGSVLSAFGDPNTVSVGASGALFGLLGGQLAYIVLNYREMRGWGMQLCNLVFIIFINFLISLNSDNIDNYAHLGGLVVGFLFQLFLSQTRSTLSPAWLKHAGLIGTIAFMATFGALTFTVKAQRLCN
ncbi:MAG: hypothetical protein MHM6MM_007320 [Cercozoa sp. M6MM]